MTVRWRHGFHDEPVLQSVVTYNKVNSKPREETIKGQLQTVAITNLTPFTNYTIAVKTCVLHAKFNVSCSDPSEKLEVTTNMSGNTLLSN